MMELAKRLSDRFGGAQAFFCNSGAEAIEAAIKYARKATGKAGVVALEGSFHGRTMGSLSITGQPAKREAFAPLLGQVSLRPPQQLALAARRRARRHRPDHHGADPGRGRRHPLDASSRRRPARSPTSSARCSASTRCRPASAARAPSSPSSSLGVRPDLVTLAKGLANGLPIGALLVADERGRAASSRATTPRPSAATRSSAPPPAPSSMRSTTSCSRTSGRWASGWRPGCASCPACARCAAPAC